MKLKFSRSGGQVKASADIRVREKSGVKSEVNERYRVVNGRVKLLRLSMGDAGKRVHATRKGKAERALGYR